MKTRMIVVTLSTFVSFAALVGEAVARSSWGK